MSARLASAPTGFPRQAAFRAWLRSHHASEPELVVRIFKRQAADQGLTYPRKPGLAAFEARSEARTGVYSFERAVMRLSSAAVRRFRAQKPAWKYFQAEAPWYRRVSTFWVMSARREETRARRLALLIMWSAKGKRIPATSVSSRS